MERMKITKILALTTAIGGAKGVINMGDALGASPFTITQKDVLMKRKIDAIIVHCSATKAGQDYTEADINRWHCAQGMGGTGYHYVIRLNGKIERGRDISLPGAHCRGWNNRSIGICYIGGLDANGKPADTRTKAQKEALYGLIKTLLREFPTLRMVMGHRDTSPDVNGNGVIEPQEYVKACPCFDVKEWLKRGWNGIVLLLMVLLASCVLSCRSRKNIYASRVATDSVAVLASAGRSVRQNLSASALSEELREHIARKTMIWGTDTVNVQTIVEKRMNGSARTEIRAVTVAEDSAKELRRTSLTEEKKERKRSDETGKSPWKRWLLALVVVAAGSYLLGRRARHR